MLAWITDCRAQSRALTVGDSVPLFSLQDQDGNTFSVSAEIGKKILVIYFYPKDESPVCTKEACAFRDNYTRFTDAGARVIAINSGSVESHKSFQLHEHLPFLLLSDPKNVVLKRFGVKRQFLFTGRKTFVIDLQGKVAFVFDSFSQGEAHAEKALQFIKQMSSAP
jgi:thioredoxin-dependent peroxiredoxin